MNFSQGVYCSFVILFYFLRKTVCQEGFVVVFYGKDNASWAGILGR